MAQSYLVLIGLEIMRGILIMSIPFGFLLYLLFAVHDERDFGSNWLPLWVSCIGGFFMSFAICAAISIMSPTDTISIITTTVLGVAATILVIVLAFGLSFWHLTGGHWILMALLKLATKSPKLEDKR